MAGGPQPTLVCEPLSLLLSPATGGSIARFDYAAPDGRKIPVFRGTDAAGASVLDQGSFPLVPFVNRIRGGRFDFRGREVFLTPNLAGDQSPLHGFGWLGGWTERAHDMCSADLGFRYPGGEWPWPFHAAQHFALDRSGLTVTLACTNEASEPMPCGLGLHPYFPCTPATVLEAEVDCAWTIDPRTLPVERVAAEGRYGLAARRICGAGLDNGFGGWRGVARLSDPVWPFTVALSSTEARYLHVYAPESGGFVAVEPVTHANAALGVPEEEWESLGLSILAPGETMRLTMRVDVTPV